jgi:hypothetical protein
MLDGLTYVGLDTETVNGRAVLICTPTEACFPKSWAHIWEFVSKHTDYITWNVSYDARAILAFLPGTVLRALREGRIATHRAWKIEYVSRKRLSVRKGKQVVYFWDAYPYYESSLDDAAHKWLGARKHRIPKAWLADMSLPLADATNRLRVIEYCKRDAGLTQKLWELVAEQYAKLDIDCYRAASPASLATRAFPDSYKHADVPGYVQGVFRRAYYGGRTEIYRRGNVGRAYCYDIHSAYPSVLSSLTDPVCCEVLRLNPGQKGPRPGACYGAYKVTVWVSPSARIGPVPYRPARGPLIYPAGVFTTWITLPEIKLLEETGIKYTLRDGLELVLSEKPRRLFPDVERYYNLRREVPAVSQAVKKVLNSVYGKLAETRTIMAPVSRKRIPRGARMHNGRLCIRTEIPTNHTHFAVAGAITGAIRARLFRAMSTNPRAIVAVHTDGIVSTKPLKLDCGDRLGQWGLDHKPERAVVIGCGVYVYWTKGVATERTRGLHLDKPLRSLARCRQPVGTFRLRHANTLADAARTGWDSLNVMETIEKRVDANMDSKRAWPRDWQRFSDVFKSSMDSETTIIVTPDMLPRRKKARRRGK